MLACGQGVPKSRRSKKNSQDSTPDEKKTSSTPPSLITMCSFFGSPYEICGRGNHSHFPILLSVCQVCLTYRFPSSAHADPRVCRNLNQAFTFVTILKAAMNPTDARPPRPLPPHVPALSQTGITMKTPKLQTNSKSVGLDVWFGLFPRNRCHAQAS